MGESDKAADRLEKLLDVAILSLRDDNDEDGRRFLGIEHWDGRLGHIAYGGWGAGGNAKGRAVHK